MLDAMRRSARSFGMKFVLMMIVLTFVFMGAGSFFTRSPDEVASVNGEPVTIEEFQNTYANIVENIRQQFGGNVDPEFLKMLNLERQALDSIIDKKLLLQVAAEKSLHVPDEALIDAIARIPAFQTNGRFDQQKYETLLRQNRLTPRQFEAMQKESILVQQIQDFVVNTVTVSESEARIWYNWDNTKINIDYVTFSPADFIDDVAVSEDEIKAYYEENNNKYRVPARTKVRYISFHPEKFVQEAIVSDEEIAAYYARNESEYKTPETATASHILIRVPEDATPAEDEEKREKAIEIYNEINDGQDFADLARQHSDCPSSEDGGSLGTFSRQDMIEPFSDKAFSLEPGETGEPVRTMFGWHIIQTEERQSETIIPLESVEDDIRAELARQKTGDVAYERAMEMYDISFDADDLVENAQKFGYEIETTNFFTRSQGPDNIRNAQAFTNEAFELPLDQISDILEIDNVYYLLQPIERKESEIQALEDVKTDVEKDLKSEKSIIAARNAAESLLENVRTSESFTEAVHDNNRIVASTGLFNRNDPVPGIGRSPEFAKAAFNIAEISKVHDSVVKTSGKYFVLRLTDQMVPDEAAFVENKEQTIRNLEARKQEETFANWMENLRQNSDIKISNRFSRTFDETI